MLSARSGLFLTMCIGTCWPRMLRVLEVAVPVKGLSQIYSSCFLSQILPRAVLRNLDTFVIRAKYCFPTAGEFDGCANPCALCKKSSE